MNQQLSLDELKVLVFEKGKATKQNKDRLFKRAKAKKNMDIIKRLKDEYHLKSARIYLERLNIGTLSKETKSPDLIQLLIEKSKGSIKCDYSKSNARSKKNVLDDKLVKKVYQKVRSSISSPFVAKQFVLEELDAVSCVSPSDNPNAQEFLNNSGFGRHEYAGAMDASKSFPEVDGTNGPQQLLNKYISPYLISCTSRTEILKIVDLRFRILELIMKDYALGKYSSKIRKITIERIGSNGNQTLFMHSDYLMNDKLLKYEKVTNNKYYNQDNKKYIEINASKVSIYLKTYEYNEDDKKTIYEVVRNEEIYEYEVESHVNSQHNPEKLVELLTNFREDTPIKYTTHIWDMSFKDDYGNFKVYLSRVKDQWTEIEEKLKELSPRLHSTIYNFLLNTDLNSTSWCSKDGDDINIGWSSLNGLDEWCNDGNDPFNFKLEKSYKIENKTISTFGEVINLFKQEIQIRNENSMLENIFINLEEELDEQYDGVFEFKLINLKGKSFYMDTKIFKDILNERIFKDITKLERHKYSKIKIEIKPNSTLNYHELRITQIGSQSNQCSHDMLNHYGADTSIIKRDFTNLCDWSIESSSETENYRINYLKSEETIDDIESLDYEPEGYTHIMKFYK